MKKVNKPGTPQDILSAAIPNDVLHVVKTLQTAGFKAFVVGGPVRDVILGRVATDWDIATDATPDRVREVFGRVVPTGLAYGTVTVVVPPRSYEITTFRSEGAYTDSRHPDAVRYTTDIEQDLSRRDFTINAMAYDPIAGMLIDPSGGYQDARKRVVKAVGNPVERFTEDALRIIRAIRFASSLGFEIERETLQAMRELAPRVAVLSHERIRDELCKLLSAETPSKGFEYMKETRVLEVILPELAQTVGVMQENQHVFDVYTHSVRSCDYAPAGNLAVRLAALFHDVGKPARKSIHDGKVTFYGHEDLSTEMVSSILQRLRFSRATTELVEVLVSNHMFNYNSDWSDSALKRLIRKVGRSNIWSLIELRYADARAMRGREVGDGTLEEMESRIRRLFERDEALTIADLKVNGWDVMRTLELKPGPQVGNVLEQLLQLVYEDPALNDRDKLLDTMKRMDNA